MTFLFIVLAMVCLGLFAEFGKARERARQSEARSVWLTKLQQLQSFSVDSLVYISADARTGLAISEPSAKVALLQHPLGWREFGFGDVVSAAISENDTTMGEPSGADRTRNAVAGAVLFGAAGALAGVHSKMRKVWKLDLKVVMNDLGAPVWQVNFLTSRPPVYSTTKKYQNALKELMVWQSRLQVLQARVN